MAYACRAQLGFHIWALRCLWGKVAKNNKRSVAPDVARAKMAKRIWCVNGHRIQ